ncbi:helix-hairpin-helix domain-containing protein [Sediminibacillus massiliensis]|uniref:helix-hairpin-helix domain-containing protein n=1 Tax=Sediminibacillus massiliensis TaxID=1926277 RepID=UPI0009883F23|nr:helix-hairpin-helix domain-containing protein [Sediminibacillus massiliensis]
MPEKRPKLPLTNQEKLLLRKSKIRMSDLHQLKVEEIAEYIDVSFVRAKTLKGLATFQQLPSIGYELADKLVNELGYYDLSQLKEENWVDVFHKLETKLGCWTDSCVEDQIMCIIHHANHPDSRKKWFEFTQERKLYRGKYGYPSSRPEKAWYEA